MEQFVVSARKYRPVTFESVVGQKSITTTLQNAIRNNHLAQAFLFCGPRGVGKTTCARILAREINISEGSDQSDFAFNIFELDAASNNSVDDIRQLIDQVRIPPQTGRYKVYIIDEVHMLSAAAFNAFLKTLEEPPAHAIFILATTEKHKILPTILSRCQIFDFQRISIEAMADHLQTIARNENIDAEPDALHIIAQKADGGLRDALSIFDQVVSFCGNKLSYQDVITNLNILDHDYYFTITDHILASNIPGALLTFNEILSKGFDGHNFVNGLSAHFRNLLVATDPSTLSLLEAGQSIRERYRQQAGSVPPYILTRGLDLLSRTDLQYKSSKQPRLLVEICLMQLCSLTDPAQAAEKKNDSPVIKKTESQPAPKQEIPQEMPSAPESIQEARTERVAELQTQPIHSGASLSAPVTLAEVSTPVQRVPRKRGISIKDITEAAKSSSSMPLDESGQQITGPRQQFSPDELKKAWEKYVDKLKTEGKSQLAISLTMRPFQLQEQTRIRLELDNAMQEELLRSEQAELMEYLRNELKNFDISLETSVSSETAERRPYTNREKFVYLSERYPLLNTLRQELGLDID